MKNIKHFILRLSADVLCILLCVLCLAGCGGSKEPAQPSPTPIVQTEEEESRAPVQGGVLITAMPANVESLDPLLANNSDLVNLLSLVYEPLVRQDNTGNLTPVLAETWSTADNGVTWTVQLRRDVKWHNSGEILSANDVLYTYDALRGSSCENSPYRAQLQRIASIQVLDEYTIVVTGTEPGAEVLFALEFPVVSRKLFTRNTGTGPYIITAADTEKGVVLTANADWWKRTPYITNIAAKCVDDGATALSLLAIRQINFAPTDAVTVSQYREEGMTNIYELYTQHAELMYFNSSSWRLTDPNVKKAIAYALDRREIISKCYYNHAVAVDVPYPPDSWLYDASTKVYDTDTTKAIALLEASGWMDYDGDGIREKKEDNGISRLKLTLLVNDTPDNLIRKDAARLIKTQLAKIGMEIEIISAQWTEDSKEYLTALAAGGFDIALAGIYLDETGDLSQLLTTGGSRNYGKYSSERMDTLIAQNAPDINGVKDKAAALQAEFIEELPFMMLYFRTYSVAYTSDLTISTDIRYTNLFNSIEKWYFNAEGRAKYTLEYAELDFYGVPALKAPVLDAPQATPAPTAEQS